MWVLWGPPRSPLGSCSEPLPFRRAETLGEAASRPCREHRPLSPETLCVQTCDFSVIDVRDAEEPKCLLHSFRPPTERRARWEVCSGVCQGGGGECPAPEGRRSALAVWPRVGVAHSACKPRSGSQLL